MQENAVDVKGGAEQCFTPRPLIKAIVRCVDPMPGEMICDPACGTGGLLLAAYEHVATDFELDRDQTRALQNGSLFGVDLVDSVAHLCAMNLLRHGIGGGGDPSPQPSPPDGRGGPEGSLPILTRDALAGKHGAYDVVLTNPPFGKKSSVTVVGEDGEVGRDALTIAREDFWATTSNQQLNFVQHVFSILKDRGRAAVVVPDNVLFEGGAGETIRRRLLQQCDVHTLLRLPAGLFYAQGVKANVLFFDKRPDSERPSTEELWIYDLRTNKRFTLKENPLREEDLKDFVTCYQSDNRHRRQESERFKSFTYDELVKRDKANLDIFWLKDE